MNDISTDAIEKRIRNAKDFDAFYTENQEHLDIIHPGQYLLEQLETRNLKKPDLIATTNLNTGYVYEILRQEKRPERDAMLQFAFGLKLDIAETQRMLKRCEYALLYGKNTRDSVIIFCISRRKTLVETNILLHEYQYPPL